MVAVSATLDACGDHMGDERNGRLNALVNSMADSIITVDDQGGIIDANPSTNRIFGYSRDELIGHDVSIILPSTANENLDDQTGRFFSKPDDQDLVNIGHEITGLHKDGTEILLFMAVDEFRIGRDNYFVAIMRDVGAQKKVEAELIEQDKRLRLSLDFGMIGIWEWSIADDHHYFDERAKQIFGFDQKLESSGAMKSEFLSHIHPKDIERVQRSLTQAIEEKCGYSEDFRILWPNEEVRWISARGEVLFDENDVAVRLTGVCMDATERKLAERKLAENEILLRQITDNLPVYVAYIDANGIYKYVNDEIEKFFGLKKEDIIGQPITNVMEASAYNRIREKIQLVLSGSKVNFESRFPRPNNGQEWDAHFTYTPHFSESGDVIGYFVLCEDVSDRKESERNLVQAKEDADSANRAKSEFLSHMSHELRTPLNAILGFAQLLSSDALEQLTGPQQEYAKHITTSGEQLLQLINEVLELSKIEAGKVNLEMESVDLSEVLDLCIGMLAGQADKMGLTIINELPDNMTNNVWTDHNRLRQILINLLSNAIKYNKENGSITISVEDGGSRDNRIFLKVKVTDTGIGIPKSLQEHLFVPFERLGNGEHDIEGTGIGLTITEKLVKLVGGELGFESQQGVGSTFWFTLPRSN